MIQLRRAPPPLLTIGSESLDDLLMPILSSHIPVTPTLLMFKSAILLLTMRSASQLLKTMGRELRESLLLDRHQIQGCIRKGRG